MRTLQFTAGPCHPSRALQRGLTLIEFMVSIAIGMIIVAALATLIANQSSNRAEVDRAGRLIESGRYAARTLTEDLQMAGYWGELTTPPALPAPTAWSGPGSTGSNPCTTLTANDVNASMGWHVTGFEQPGAAARPGYNGTAIPPTTLSCLSDVKPGTDVVVIRRADPDSTPYEIGGAVDLPTLAKAANPVNSTRLFIQTGIDPATGLFASRIDVGANGASFNLKKKDGVARATVRRMVIRIYYVTTCSVCTGTPDFIPSLKMKELVEGPAWSDAVTIAEGIENLQIEYGVDAAATQDGTPDADMVASAVALGDWPGVVSAKLYLLARSVDPAPGYDECSDPANIPASCKQYPLGAAGTVLPAGAERRYKRHVFVQSVRLVNPSFRRAM